MKLIGRGCLGAIMGATVSGIISGLALYPFLKPEHKSADLERFTFYVFGIVLCMVLGAVIGAVWRIWPKF
jgi:hypothetical protein